jgi:hypothetical protein
MRVGTCPNCGKRPGTLEWVGEGGTLAFVHGMSQLWCEICCLKTQLIHFRAMASKIPETEARLAELLKSEEPNASKV